MKVYSVSVSYPWDLPPRSFTCSTSDRSSLQTRCKKQTSGHLEVFTQLTCHFDFEFAVSTKFHANSQLMDVGSLDSWLRIYAWHWHSHSKPTQKWTNIMLQPLKYVQIARWKQSRTLGRYNFAMWAALKNFQAQSNFWQVSRCRAIKQGLLLQERIKFFQDHINGICLGWVFALQSKSTKFRAEKSARKCGSRKCGSVQTNELQFSKRAYVCTANVKTLVATICNHIIEELFKKFHTGPNRTWWKPHNSTIHTK